MEKVSGGSTGRTVIYVVDLSLGRKILNRTLKKLIKSYKASAKQVPFYNKSLYLRELRIDGARCGFKWFLV